MVSHLSLSLQVQDRVRGVQKATIGEGIPSLYENTTQRLTSARLFVLSKANSAVPPLEGERD